MITQMVNVKENLPSFGTYDDGLIRGRRVTVLSVLNGSIASRTASIIPHDFALLIQDVLQHLAKSFALLLRHDITNRRQAHAVVPHDAHSRALCARHIRRAACYK